MSQTSNRFKPLDLRVVREDVTRQLRVVMGHVRRLRLERQLTQAELAEHINVSHSYMSKLERSKVAPSFTVICSLARVLQTHLASFFQDDSN